MLNFFGAIKNGSQSDTVSVVQWNDSQANTVTLWLEINWYDIFGANTDADASANYGSIADTNHRCISKIFKSCFLLHYHKYNVLYALPSEKLHKSGFTS